MQWYALNKEYVNYLKQYDELVPNIEYTGRLKCFLGIVFKNKEGCKCYNKTDRKIQFKIDRILSVFLIRKIIV